MRTARHALVASVPLLLLAAALPATDVWLSDLAWTSAGSGWGPIEKDRSNGEQGATDGRALTIGGTTYAKGLGMHATADARWALGGAYASFQSDVGVDDEVGDRGSVVFQVWVDGVKRWDSGTRTGAMGRLATRVDVTGGKELRLVVTDAGDNAYFDHADWGGASLTRAATGIAWSGPITITAGGTYTGNWQTANGKAAVTIATSAPVTITDANVRGDRAMIVASVGHAKLTVRNTTAAGTDDGVDTRFIDLDGWDSLTVTRCTLTSCSGISCAHYAGDRSVNQTARILNNRAQNIIGDPNDLLQFFQMDQDLNLAGAEIAWNQVVNEPGKSQVEDNISIYESCGTSASPIRIHDNYIQGGYARNPVGADYSGGGIMAGDGGKGLAGWIDVANNQVVGTSNYGIAISAGHDSTLHDNRIVSCGLLPDGRKIPYQNVGLYIWDSYHTGHVHGDSAARNEIGWVLGSGRNDSWTPDGANTGQVALPNPITLATEQAEWQAWLQKLAKAGQAVGATR